MKSKTVVKTSMFPATADEVFEKLTDLGTLQQIAAPYASFTPICDNQSNVWCKGQTYSFRFKLFCLIPFGTHTIHVVRLDRQRYEIYTNEVNTHVPVWNHRIYLKPAHGTSTEYTDEVEIFAGWITPFVYLWAKCFYAHRQKRWIRLLNTEKG